MAQLTVQTMTTAGMTPTYAAAANSSTIGASDALTGGVFLHVKNTNGSSMTVTITDPGASAAGSTVTSAAITVAATTGDVMIPILPAHVNNSTQAVAITYSALTSVTVAAIRR